MKLSRNHAIRFLGAAAAVVTVPAQAAVDVAVTTAITTGVTDAATIGGAILALVIGIAIFRHIRAAK